jgi:pimeloyl-ACP methyl ester carboxylesterase
MSERATAATPLTSSDNAVLPTPSTSRIVRANGIDLHYLDYGGAEGRTMLCIHGGAAHAHWFDFVAGGFTSEYHVLSLDLRGHGDSAWTEPPAYGFAQYASDVNALAEALDLKDFVLVGHSMGGMVSLVYAATYPGRPGTLVVVDSRMLMPVNRVAAMREAGTRAAKQYASQDDLIARYRLEPPGTHTAPPDRVRHIALQSGRARPDGTWQHKFDRRVFAQFERVDGIPLWERVRIPALIVKAARSHRIDDDTFAQVKSRAPQVEAVEVPDADHHIMLDNPAGFVAAVTGFLAKPQSVG